VLEEARSKDVDAGRKGKAIEHLVAASCILSSGGELNVSTSMVDDEGVDLVFHRRGRAATLAVQVKSRTFDGSKSLRNGTFRAFVRAQTFGARTDLYILFVAVDMAKATYDPVWLVPSTVLADRVRPGSRNRFQFAASAKATSQDRWAEFRLTREELPRRLLEILPDLERRPAEGHQRALNRAASSEPRVASPALYEWAPAPASRPLSTIRYSSRIGRPSNQHSRISRTPAA
jgi:hypothetical protein